MIECLSYDDVLIKPVFSDIESRDDVNTATKIGHLVLKVPIISSPMDTVTSVNMAVKLGELGGLGILHRFCSVEEEIDMIKSVQMANSEIPFGFAIGVTKSEQDRFMQIVDNVFLPKHSVLCIDVANGYSSAMEKMIKFVKNYHPAQLIMAGNVAWGDGYKFLADLGVNAVRSGIGGGCVGANTRILMANGTYKNIIDVKNGDYVINKDGNAVAVKKLIYSGFKKVKKIRLSCSAEELFITDDHNIFIGDIRYSQADLRHIAKAKFLSKKDKYGNQKFNWLPIEKCIKKKTVPLRPININFQIPENFIIDLEPYFTKYKYNPETQKLITSDNCECNKFIHNSYDTGYIFGTFLGDGTAFLNKYKNSKIGNVSWSFNINEKEIVFKLQKAIKTVFNLDTHIKECRSVLKLYLYSKPLAHFFNNFGKKINKKLPENFLVSDINYLNGLLDGLIDSDGCVETNGRKSFYNTSKYLSELQQTILMMLKMPFSAVMRNKTSGGLKNCNIDNCYNSYVVRTQTSNHNVDNKYLYNEILAIEDYPLEIETYDLEIDCPTHSFIANNMIIHNSICSTRIKTGVGVPTLASVMSCYEHAMMSSPLLSDSPAIIADGGITYPSDLCKALIGGASAVMCGNILAGTKEAPGEVIASEDGKTLLKRYRGMASKEIQEEKRGGLKKGTVAEGVSTLIPYQGDLEEVITEFSGGLRSSMTYVNARNLSEYIGRSEELFIRITNSGISESHAYGTRKR